MNREFDRLPPCNVDAEMCLIASMMLDKDCIPDVAGVVTGDAFFQADNQTLFGLLKEMHAKHTPIDAIALREELARRKLLEEVGGSAYIAELLNKVPSAAHVMHYAKIVRDAATWRTLISTCNEVLRSAYAPHDEDDAATEAASKCARRCAAIAAEGKVGEVFKLGDVAREVASRCEDGDVTRRISTGMAKLDEVIGGLRLGGKTIVAGKPGMGKSLCIKQMLRNIAASGTPAGIITVEEDRYKIAENALSSLADVPNNRIAFGRMTPHDRAAVRGVLPYMDTLPFYGIDTARKTAQIVAAATSLATRYGCKVIAVDHVHIIDHSSGGKDRQQNREREISEISAALKWAWKELNVAGVEAAQLNRKSGHERPDLDSLRDSGSLAQDGDVILMLHREDYYRVEEHKPDQPPPQLDGVLEVLVRKNKDGAKATVELRIDEATQSITDPATTGDPFAPGVPQLHPDLEGTW